MVIEEHPKHSPLTYRGLFVEFPLDNVPPWKTAPFTETI